MDEVRVSEQHEETSMLRCTRCTGLLSVRPSGAASHEKRCRVARQWQREHYARTGSWPERKSAGAIVDGKTSKSHSRQRGVANTRQGGMSVDEVRGGRPGL